MFERLKALYRSAVYTVTDWYKFEKGLKDLTRAIPVWQAQAWIEYITVHSALSRAQAVKMYSACGNMPIKKFTPRKAKRVTKMIMG